MAQQLKTAVQQNGRLIALASAAAVATPSVVFLSGDGVKPPAYPWRHTGYFSSYDCGAMRRGFQVYREVCASCHSLDKVRWRELVGVTHTKEEVKTMAKEVEYVDGPDKEGEMYERPGKLTDILPKPYDNPERGRAANGGALPPDLSYMVLGRHEGHDYIFALLTGYVEPPAGKVLMEGLYYNPYFPGGGIRMPPPLQDEGVEYEDGTIATASQQARDVVQFLHWCSEPEQDGRKKDGVFWMLGIAFFSLAAGYKKRVTWSVYKSKKISYVKGSMNP